MPVGSLLMTHTYVHIHIHIHKHTYKHVRTHSIKANQLIYTWDTGMGIVFVSFSKGVRWVVNLVRSLWKAWEDMSQFFSIMIMLQQLTDCHLRRI